MRCVPPFALMDRWLTACVVPGTTLVRPLYDDVLDVLRALVAIVPVDEAWYRAEYPSLAILISRTIDETPTTHFRKHGYFEGREPFAPGWLGLRRPIPFAELKTNIRVRVGRGRLLAEIEREDFLGLVRKVLSSISVDESWYQAAYPTAGRTSDLGASHPRPATIGRRATSRAFYPPDVDVDETWYRARYAHVRTSLAVGSAVSAKDHFVRIGYGEGCQPAAP